MWGFQRHFQNSVQRKAEKLFHALDPHFEIETFLLGLVRKQSPEDHPICLEPEECSFEPEQFAEVRQDADHYWSVDPERNLVATAESHMRSIQRRVSARAEHNAVMKALESRHGGGGGKLFFSGFMPVANYDVGVVLRLNHRQNILHYSLAKIHAYKPLRVPSSLTESAINLFLKACCKSLHVPEPELVDEWDGPVTEEMLRKAGDRLMEAPVFAGGGVDGLYCLFDACNYIAALPSERSFSNGELLIAREGHPNILRTLKLSKPIPLNKHRAIRKLLEISSAGDAILTDGNSVIGFGKRCGNYDQSQADLLEVSFTGHHQWELSHAEHKLMRVIFGQPALPLPPLNQHRFAEDIERIFTDISHESVQTLFALSEQACQQRHGTILVITPEAASEAKRLESQATGIVPVHITPELLASVTAIDGAVMLDTNGTCHAIGVILDGVAVPNGNPARGARYNSSLRYAAQMQAQEKGCLVIIVSEDGTAEWIPKLIPRLSLRELKTKESEADAILALTDFPISRTGRLLRWLSEHRFYLSLSLCEKANRLSVMFNNVLTEKGAIFFRYENFEPDSRMSNDYLKC